MNHRKLQKKIRQAFTNATPDLAENIAVESLFTDKPETEMELPPSKPVRTPIQFRATAALVASILVVALLISLIPTINPFLGPNAPDNVTPIEPTTPDKDSPYSSEELNALKQSIFDNADVPFSYEDATLSGEIYSWKGRRYHSVTLKSKAGQTAYYLVDDETMTVHPYENSFNWADFNRFFNPVQPAKQKNEHRFVLVDNKLCHVIAADYGSSGELVVIDAKTLEVLSREDMIGSNKARKLLFEREYLTGINSIQWDWTFDDPYKLNQYTYCIELEGAVTAWYDVFHGELVQILYHGSTDDTSGPPLKPTPEYAITEENAFNIALEHAGLTKDDLNNYLIGGNFQLVFPYYEVTLYTDAYKYHYWIDASYGTVAQLDRSYAGELTSDDINSSLTPDVAAVEFAKDDPMIKYKDPAFKSVTATPPYYTVRMQAREYHCKVEVSVTHGIVTDLHMINTNFFIVIDDGVNFQLTPIMPHREPMIDFTSEQLKIWLNEGISYGEVKLLIGEQTSNVSPTPIDEPWYVWYFNEGIYNGMRLEILFKYPGYDHIDDWYVDMNVPIKPDPDNPDASYYEDDGSYMNTWLHNMVAISAIVRNGDETVEVLFGKDWYAGQGTDEPDQARPPEYPINQMDAYDMALQHAGITNDDVEHGDISLTSSGGISHYLIVINTADYQYTYQISDKYGVIISADRYLREPLNFKHESILDSNALSKDAALEVAKKDPMFKDSLEFVSVDGPYFMTDAYGNPYSPYEVHFKGDAYGDPKYIFVVCQSHKFVERVIMHTDETIFYEDEPVVPDGRIGKERAIAVAMDYAGTTLNSVAFLSCEEVTDDPEMANHYDVVFYYENFKWHYKIGMYNPTLLEIVKLPIEG